MGQELVKKVQAEYYNSGGALSLNFEEFCEFFKLEVPVARDLIKELCATGWFQFIKTVDSSSGEESDRLQIHPKYRRNFWVYSELVPTEAKAVLKLGALLKSPFNSLIKNLEIEDQHLVKLILQDQNLRTLPSSIDNFTHLKTLKIQRCKLASLPDTIGNLKNLQELDLDWNELTVLPETIGKLENLKELWIRHNRLTALPKTLDSLKNLRINRHYGVVSPNTFTIQKGVTKQLIKTIAIGVWGLGESDLKTILQTLNTGKWIPDTTPIIGKNGETIRNEDIKFSKFLYGPQEFKPRWGHPNSLIYIIDLNNLARFPESRKVLWQVLKRRENIPVAIFTNKDDLVDYTEEYLENLTSINTKISKNFSIFKINTVTGEGIRKGIYWLINSLLDYTKKPDKGGKYELGSENLLKICIVGSSSELQPQFVRRFAEGKFDGNYLPTLGVDITTKKMTVKGTQVKLILVDTAGQEFFGKLRPNYYRGASACIIVFDKSDRRTFDAVPSWLHDFCKYVPCPETPVAILGINTKEEDVSTDEGKALAESLNMRYFEASSPTFEKSPEVFQYLCEKVINHKR